MSDFVQNIWSAMLSSRWHAVDVTYDMIDEALLSSRFGDAKKMLADIDASDLPRAIKLSAKIAMLPWKSQLEAA